MHERNGKASVLILLGVLGLLALAVVWLWTRGSGGSRRVAQESTTSDAFLALVRAGDVDAAWKSTTSEFKSALGREKFVKYVAQNSFLRQPLHFVSVQSVMLHDQPRAEFQYRKPDGSKTVLLLVG